jgi:pilus assembly protein CpaB
MSPVRLIVLLVAAGAAIAAVFLVRMAQGSRDTAAPAELQANAPPPKPEKQVLVARKTLKLGDAVEEGDLGWQTWPEGGVSKAFTVKSGDGGDQLEAWSGAIVRQAMLEGEPVVEGKLFVGGKGGVMAALVAEGYRAASVEITPETAAGGFILPGDRVDVIFAHEVPSPAGDGSMTYIAETILQNIRVLAIDGVIGPEKDVEASVVGSRATLELQQADMILLASADRAGDISLVLRPVADWGAPQGATAAGQAWLAGRTGVGSGVRIFRNGRLAAAAPPPG